MLELFLNVSHSPVEKERLKKTLYAEKIPFSPGDLNIEEVYSNANAEIWRIKKN